MRSEIYTDLFLPALSNYSRKAKSLAALMRSESETYAATSNAPDVITIIFELSVENMESVASILDPIVETMRQSETIDLAIVSCSIGQILTHICAEIVPSLVSIITNPVIPNVEEMYDNFIATTPLLETITPLVNANQCSELNDSGTSAKTEILANASILANTKANGSYLGMVGGSFLVVSGIILFFPLSVIVSSTTLILSSS